MTANGCITSAMFFTGPQPQQDQLALLGHLVARLVSRGIIYNPLWILLPLRIIKLAINYTKTYIHNIHPLKYLAPEFSIKKNSYIIYIYITDST